MMMKILATATCLSVCAATSGLAATFNVRGIDYEVSSIRGSFEDNETLLRSQVWWGDGSSLAEEFATTVGAVIGDTPVFLYVTRENTFADRADRVEGIWFIGNLGLDAFAARTTHTDNYAIATQVSATPLPTAPLPTVPVPAVPLPAGGLLLLSGLGGIATLKRRKKRVAKL